MLLKELKDKIEHKQANIGIIGLGYVGLPILVAFAKKGFSVLGFDVDRNKIEQIKKGHSYIRHISSENLKNELIDVTDDMSRLGEVDVIIICVPTPLDVHREPDLSYVVDTAHAISRRLRIGQLVVLESTTYPGTTEEVMLPILAKSGLVVGQDFSLAYSPEREDPANENYSFVNVPKVVGGVTPLCLDLVEILYNQIIIKTVPVSSTQTAEATKILENIYRAVNIALVNELKIIFQKMNIDIWEVIEAAKTKPFGFHAFYPGPGWGGHCIPIDPFYLTWKAREYDVSLQFIELAGEVNTLMPNYVVERLSLSLNQRCKPLKKSRILILGVAYKKNVDDQRESPSLKIIQLLKQYEAYVDYHDPYAPVCANHRHYPEINLTSVPLTKETLHNYDAVIIVTDHDDVDYQLVAESSSLIIDTRNVLAAKGFKTANTVSA
ncbi:nucleotide sugar dehydrogenase [Aetokthonos hydrillicola Thurmond2011]|jgi:UDP-N-acetyl-D-glucosamine dehydrogenase|uniref:Nucleotide sugar dehydrogenase n=1 Tax=Aetokthonos hydrillicola Thurmond2011 TaxID=2712845 RepID=A0AAP5I6J7_9CYAN|nr:nucleotide sugar dehydrogenase [Aetokthonos hydrillicola]MBO3462938.1 nucleotide sugar dehydrogenase [Aetokthonos hydrillicola CCALA 1050]MDR9894582.1 nucleotide sugar dehydrogenase [Aetokthonos hydrillicola Thurmond2011]